MLVLKVDFKNGSKKSFTNIVYVEERKGILVFIGGSGYEQTISLSETLCTYVVNTEKEAQDGM